MKVDDGTWIRAKILRCAPISDLTVGGFFEARSPWIIEVQLHPPDIEWTNHKFASVQVVFLFDPLARQVLSTGDRLILQHAHDCMSVL